MRLDFAVPNLDTPAAAPADTTSEIFGQSKGKSIEGRRRFVQAAQNVTKVQYCEIPMFSTTRTFAFNVQCIIALCINRVDFVRPLRNQDFRVQSQSHEFMTLLQIVQ